MLKSIPTIVLSFADRISAMHDMGAKYPNATGHPDGEDEYMPVEECGNNLIMMLATHDALLASAETEKEITYAKSWLTSHYEIALQWSQCMTTLKQRPLS